MAAEAFDVRLREVERAAQSTADGLSSHEKICAERYSNIHGTLNELKDSNAKRDGWMLKIGFGLIAGMAAILVKLVFFVDA